MQTDWGMFIFFAIVCVYLACVIGYHKYKIDKLEEEIDKLKKMLNKYGI